MKIKVCGMRNAENIHHLGQLDIDYVGLIFYPKSPRFVEESLNIDLPEKIKKIGVFVNANKEYILQKMDEYKLSMVQLHGNETPEFCKDIYNTISTLKVFSIGDVSDFQQTKAFENICDYFLFDTKTSLKGGSGQKFEWEILKYYKGDKPFFLSGGISDSDAKLIRAIGHPQLYGIDINSRFEIEPGLKDINKIENFINNIRS